MSATGTVRQRVGVAVGTRAATAARLATAEDVPRATARGKVRAAAPPANETRPTATPPKALRKPLTRVRKPARTRGTAVRGARLRPLSEAEVRNYLPLVRQVVQRMLPR